VKNLELVGRVLGAAAGGVLAILWMYAIWFPDAGMTLGGPSVAIAWLMALTAVFGGVASAKGHFTVVFAIFLLSFLPIGAYMLYVNGWPRIIGVADCALLVACVLIWRGAKGRAAT